MVVNPSHLPGVLILKAELHHSAPLTVACVQASSWLGSADWHDLCGKFSLFCLPSTCCCVPLWGDCEKLPLWWAPLVPAWWGHFWECAETFPPSLLPPQGADPPLKFFVSFFYLYLLPYLILRRMACIFGSLGSSVNIQEVFCRSVPHAEFFLMYLLGGRWSPCLTPSPSWKPWCDCFKHIFTNSVPNLENNSPLKIISIFLS